MPETLNPQKPRAGDYVIWFGVQVRSKLGALWA